MNFVHVLAKDTHTIVITCATGELGAATARLLACDHHLILTGRNISKLQQLQQELKANNSCNYEIASLDFSDRCSIAQFKTFLNRIQRPIAGLVLIGPRPQFFGGTLLNEEEEWLKNFQLTVTGPMEALKTLLPHFKPQSKIVVMAGNTSVQFNPEYGSQCVIRRMLTAIVKGLSQELGPQGISVNAISPGVVLTQFHQDRIRKTAEAKGLNYEEQMQQEVEKIPLRRHAQTQEIARAIRFLLSEESNFITGANLVIDGGITVSY